MKLIYSVHVEIPAAPLALRRRFYFATADERDSFSRLCEAYGFAIIIGQGIDHVLTADEAFSECLSEQRSVP